MMKVCINCHTENPLDEVFCSECGMSLTRAPTGEEALKARKAFEAESPSRRRSRARPEQLPLVRWVLQHARLLVMLVGCGIISLWSVAVSRFEEWVPSSPSEACLATVFVFLLFPLVIVAITLPVLALAWRAAQGLGAGFAEMWADRMSREEEMREGRRLGADMIRCHLAGIELSKADLEGANAAGANLEGAILPEASLVGASLREANLSRANLERSDLSNANLFGANLEAANLEGANLRSADLYRANLRGAVLKGADFEEADLQYGNLEGANVEGAHLAGANLNDNTVMPEGWEEIVASRPEDEPLSESANEGEAT